MVRQSGAWHEMVAFVAHRTARLWGGVLPHPAENPVRRIVLAAAHGSPTYVILARHGEMRALDREWREEWYRAYNLFQPQAGRKVEAYVLVMNASLHVHTPSTYR